jgi:hypothetical protein
VAEPFAYELVSWLKINMHPVILNTLSAFLIMSAIYSKTAVNIKAASLRSSGMIVNGFTRCKIMQQALSLVG